MLSWYAFYKIRIILKSIQRNYQHLQQQQQQQQYNIKMAFDHQLECDQIDFAAENSILFSIFLRLPLLILAAILDSLKENNTAIRMSSSSNSSSSNSNNKLERCFVSIVVGHHKYTQQAEQQATNDSTQKWCPSLQTIDEENSKDIQEDKIEDEIEEQEDKTEH